LCRYGGAWRYLVAKTHRNALKVVVNAVRVGSVAAPAVHAVTIKINPVGEVVICAGVGGRGGGLNNYVVVVKAIGVVVPKIGTYIHLQPVRWLERYVGGNVGGEHVPATTKGGECGPQFKSNMCVLEQPRLKWAVGCR